MQFNDKFQIQTFILKILSWHIKIVSSHLIFCSFKINNVTNKANPDHKNCTLVYLFIYFILQKLLNLVIEMITFHLLFGVEKEINEFFQCCSWLLQILQVLKFIFFTIERLLIWIGIMFLFSSPCLNKELYWNKYKTINMNVNYQNGPLNDGLNV